ncbi:MAG: hypothetical protein ACRC2J_20620 [Microcoleaceae cyanobacterium]
MKYLTYLLTLGGLMVAINLPAHATNVGSIVQITDNSNNSGDVVLPNGSPAPGSDRR